jgi:dTDP-4-amino-4,6-dideoxygalactose transaminase
MLEGTPVVLPPEPPSGTTHAYHIFPVQVPDRRRVFEAMRADGIGVQVHYVPIYRHPIYAPYDADPARYPNTEAAYEGLLSLPMFPDLRDDEQDRVVEILLGAM